MLPFFLLPLKMQEQIREAERAAAESKKELIRGLCKDAQPWDLNIKWPNKKQPQIIAIKASTFTPRRLFDTEPVPSELFMQRKTSEHDIVKPIPLRADEDESFQRFWVYRNAILPKHAPLPIYLGNRRAEVVFDDDIVTPVLLEHRPWVTWDNPFTVWMGITPMEMITQRAGIKHCTGTVCIGGLGLGWFLREVHAKKSVKKIVVVEKDKTVLEWIGPAATEGLDKVELVEGDVFEHLMDNHGSYDKIALDVFDSYGHNNAQYDYRIYKLLYQPDHFKSRVAPGKLWCWGAATIGQREGQYY